MKFTVDSSELASALEVISIAAGEEDKAVPVNNQIRISGGDAGQPHVLIQARGSLCTISLPMTAAYAEPFDCCLEYRQLVNLVKMLKGEISFEVKDGWARLRCGTSRLRVPAFDPKMFPAVLNSRCDLFTYMAVTSETFVRMLQSAYIAVAKEDSGAFALRGIQMQYSAGLLRVVGCDGHEACKSEVAVSGSKCQPFDVILPQISAPALIRLAKGCDNVLVHPGFTDKPNRIEFVIGETVCIFSLAAGDYPDVNKLIPVQDHHVEVDSREISGLLKRAALFSDQAYKTRVVHTVWGPESLLVQAASQNTGTYNESIPIDGRSAGIKDDIVIAISSSQVLAALGAFSEERAMFLFTSEAKPMHIRPVDCPFDIDYVTMPHRALNFSGLDLDYSTD